MAQFAIDEILTTGIQISGFVFDRSYSLGTAGQVLTSTSSGVMWQADSSIIDLSALSGQIVSTGALLNNRINSLSGYVNGTFVSGSGVANYVARWSNTKELLTGSIYDLGTGIGIGTINPGTKLDVVGAVTMPVIRQSTTLYAGTDIIDDNSTRTVYFNIPEGGNNPARYFKVARIKINANYQNVSLNGYFTTTNSALHVGFERKVEFDFIAYAATNPGAPQVTYLKRGPDTTNVLVYAVPDGGGAGTTYYDVYIKNGWYNDTNGELAIRVGYSSAVTVWQAGLDSGTSAPVDTLVNPNSNYAFDTAGNVGVGTTNPTVKLHVVGNGLLTNTSAVDLRIDASSLGNASLTIDRQTTAAESKILLLDANISQWGIAAKSNSNNFVIRDADSTERFTILKTNGNIGIGTTNPAVKLHIENSGTISSIATVRLVGSTGNNAGSQIEFYKAQTPEAAIGLASAVTGGLSDDLLLLSTNPNSIVLAAGLSGLATFKPDGKVGIGIYNPVSLLSIGGAASTSAESGLSFGQDAQANLYRSAEDTIKTDGSLVVAVNATFAGNVGIGLTNPAVKLDVSGGNARFSDYIIIGEDLAYPSNTGSAYLGYSTSPASSPQSNLELIDALSNAIGVNDPLRFRATISGQYFSGNNWYADPAPLSYGTLLNGNANSYLDLVTSSEYSVGISGKRFVVDQGTSYTRPNFILLNTDWNQNFWGFKLNVENSNDLINWTNCITEQAFSTNNTKGTIALSIANSIQGGGASRYFRFSFVANQIISAGALRVNKIRSLGNQNYSSTIPVSTSVAGNLIASVGIISPTITSLSGNLATTGSVLDTKINTLSGYSNSTFATITNLAATGSTLNARINSLSGYAGSTFLSGQGVANWTARWNGTKELITGSIYDLGTGVGIGTTNPVTLLTVGSTTTTTSSMTLQGEYQSSTFNNTNIFNFRHGGFDRWRLLTTQNSAASNDFDFSINAINATANGYNTFLTIKGLNGSVGIGATSPVTLLSVGGAGSTLPASGITFGADASANLYRSAAGTLKTDGRLNIVGDADNSTPDLFFNGAGGFGSAGGQVRAWSPDNTTLSWYWDNTQFTYNNFPVRVVNASSVVRVYFAPSSDSYINNASNFGIGTNAPGTRLDVRFPTNPATDNGAGNNVLRVWTTAGYAADVGGAIGLGGEYSGGLLQSFGQIAGRKSNGISGNNAGYLQFATTNNGGTMSEWMRIDAGGKVGIGTNAPNYNLDVIGSVRTSGELISEGNNARISLFRNNGINYFDWSSGQSLYFSTQTSVGGAGRSTLLAVTSGGNVGIGTLTPNGKLHVVSPDSAFAFSVAGATKGVRFNVNSAGTYIQGVDNTLAGSYQSLVLGGSDLYFQTNGLTNAVYIDSSGDVGINTTSPTSKLNVVETTPTGTRIQLGTASASALMNSDSTNDLLILNAPYGANPASASNLGAKWGIKFIGSTDALLNSLGKTSAIYAVSEDTLGYNRGTSLAFYTNQLNDVVYAERMRIYHNGNIGIGITNPSNKLHISGGGISFTTSTGLAVPMIGLTAVNVAYIGPYTTSTDGNAPTLVVFNQGSSVQQTYFYSSGRIAMVLNKEGRLNIAGNAGNTPPALLNVGPASSVDAVSGMSFGNDSSANLYRSAASTIKTDGNINIVGTATLGPTVVNGGTLPSSPTGSTVVGFNYNVNNGNISQVNFVEKRFATGGDWTTATTRIQKRVDVTDQAYIEFNPSGALYGMALGVGANSNVEALRILSNGNVGIGTVSPVTKLHIEQIQNAESLITLRNNRQDLADVPIFGISAQNNITDVAKISFYRGGGGNAGYLTFSTKADNASSLTEKVRIDGSGNIGIGQTNPLSKFVVSGGTVNTTTYTTSEARIADGSLHLMKTVAGGIFESIRAMNMDTTAGTTVRVLAASTSDPFNNGNGGKVFIDAIRTATNMDLAFSLNDVAGAAAVERVRFMGNGNVGIGITNPACKLDVAGTIRSSTNEIYGFGASDNVSLRAASTVNVLGIYTSNVERLRLAANGYFGVGTDNPSTLLSIGRAGSTAATSGITFGADSQANLYRISSARIKTDGNFTIDGQGGGATSLVLNRSSTSSENGMAFNTAGSVDWYFFINDGGTDLQIQRSSEIDSAPRVRFNGSNKDILFNLGGGNIGVGTSIPTGKVHIVSSIIGETVLRADGTNGTLFSVVDDLSDSLMSVNNSAGLPVLEVFADDRVVAGQYGSGDFVVANNKVGIGTTNPINKLSVIGAASIGSTSYNIAAPTNGLLVEGNVGIGTTSVGNPLEVYGTSMDPSLTPSAASIFSVNSLGVELAVGRMVTSPFSIWLQGKHATVGGNLTYPIVLNPLGGNVGIGVTNPIGTYGKLSVAGGIRILDDNNGKLEIGRYSSAASDSYIKLGSNSNSLRITNNTDAADIFTILNGGNVGIGTISPNYLTDIQSTSSALTLNLKLNKASTTNDYAEIAFQLWAGAGSGPNTFGGAGNSRAGVVLRALNENGTSAAGAFIIGTFEGGSTNVTLTEKFRLASNGNVGIGTNVTPLKLNVSGSIYMAAGSGSAISWSNDISSQFLKYDSVTDGMVLSSWSHTTFLTQQIERVRITSNGNVGIGTTNPAHKLEVFNTANSQTYVRVNNQDTGGSAYAGLDLQSYGGGWQVRVPASTTFVNPLIFSFNEAERARITSAGNVGIGLTVPTDKIQISGGGISLTTSTGLAVPMLGMTPLNIAYVGPYNTPTDGNAPSTVLFNHGASVQQTWFYSSGSVAMVLNRQGRLHIGNLNNAPNCLLSVGPSSSTTAVSGMCFGNDAQANLYRSAEDTIKTDGNLSVAGTLTVGGAVSLNGHIYGNKSVTLSTASWTTVLTVNMLAHNSCYVKIGAFGDWSNHSAIAFVSELFIQNGNNSGYGEPGTIITAHDNTAGAAGDKIDIQIVDPAAAGTQNFLIQLKLISATSSTNSSIITYHVMGQQASVT